MESRRRYDELVAKVEQFFERTQDAHAQDMMCRTGCSDCCHARLTITMVEAAAIAEGIEAMSADERERLVRTAQTNDVDRCGALDTEGRCLIYSSRPLVCRSHGVPVRTVDARSLPVVDVCFRNFTAGTQHLPREAVLDQTTLSTMLGAIDNLYADEAALPRGCRLDLADLLSSNTATGGPTEGGDPPS